jgi:hypothetical protein
MKLGRFLGVYGRNLKIAKVNAVPRKKSRKETKNVRLREITKRNKKRSVTRKTTKGGKTLSVFKNNRFESKIFRNVYDFRSVVFRTAENRKCCPLPLRSVKP